jgi:hypothetical protein
MILNAAATFSLVAPPPTSRKFAGELPVRCMSDDCLHTIDERARAMCTIVADNIHRCHCQTRSVHHAADFTCPNATMNNGAHKPATKQQQQLSHYRPSQHSSTDIWQLQPHEDLPTNVCVLY